MAFDINTKANIAFKRALGRVHSSNDRDPANEPNPTKLLIAAQDIWANSVDPDPLSTENNGVIARGDSGDPHGKGTDDRLILELKPISGTDNYGPYSGFHVVVPDPVPASLDGLENPMYTDGRNFSPGDRIGNIIPATFGFNLRPRIFNGGTEIPVSHESDWYLDSYAGVFTQEDDEPAKMVDYGNSGYIHCYVYIGDYVSDRLSSLGGGTTYTFYENQTIGNGVSGTVDGVNKDFTLDNTPITGSQQVFLNGMVQTPGDDYTISGSVITFSEAPQVVIFNEGEADEEQYPDQIMVNYRV